MMTPPTGIERLPPIEIDGGGTIWAVIFSANGEYLVSGGLEGVRVWRVEDGRQMASMEARGVWCLAVSKDCRWIAAGTLWGKVFVWDARSYRRVLSLEDDVNGIDFSPDSTRLVVASYNRTVTVWVVATRQPAVGPLHHDDWVRAAKYSPQGDRIATATRESVRIYDSTHGRLLVDVDVKVSPWYNTGLLWSSDQLFLVSDGKIKQVEASTGLTISGWPVSDTKVFSCIAMPQHGEFIAYSSNHTAMFWDTSTHVQLGLVQHTQDISSIAISANGRFLAIGGEDGRITIKCLSRITEPHIYIDDTVTHPWNHDHLANADVLLTQAVHRDARYPSHHVLASRALVRARLGQWDAAIDDAKKSVQGQPSVIGYVAKSVALVGMGKRHEAYRTCDIAFEHFHSTHVTFLLLIKAIIVFMAGEHEDAISRLDDLIATVPFDSICYVVQAYMYLFSGNSHMENHDYVAAIESFERARTQMRPHTSRLLLVVSLISGWKFDDLDITIRQRSCEALYAASCMEEGIESLLTLVGTHGKAVYMSASITKWISDFTHRCLSAPEGNGDVASKVGQHGKATMLHADLSPTTPTPLLREWAKSTLASGEWQDALLVTIGFTVPRFTIYRVICEHLEMTNRIMDAAECFLQTVCKLETNVRDEQAQWVLDFRCHCLVKLERLGDSAMRAERLDDAVSHYSTALLLGPPVPQGLFVRRSEAYVARGSWEDALTDANRVIELDPSSPWGYERKHAALHEAGDYGNAIDAFETMLSKMSPSPDPDIRDCRRQYVNPGETKVMIRRAVQDVIRELPRVLINTISGHLLNKSEQAAIFESLPVFKKLISSMTTRIDHVQIENDVTHYYRYAMLSHKWEDNEPLFGNVIHITVYDLEESLTNDKLQMFCKIVRDAGLHWAWSDTCCIDKADHFLLQEALVAMFKWYQGAAVTIVFLRGVRSPSQRGDLVKNVWNTRAWTFQEYHASKMVRFYTEDWTPYLNLDIPNHKDSPDIISEMEEATGVSAQALMALQPGSDHIREKLCVASRRETTLVEDAAYSLLGIFSISLPIVYGEGDQALGRLLAQLVTNSGDTSIIAWTGKSGSFNSCLPANITVLGRLPTTHIPLAIEGAEMDVVTTRLRVSSLNITLVMRLYDRLNELPMPLFAGKRMKLPSLTFKLGRISASGQVFRAKADALGVVEIRTSEDLSRLDSLILVHPWIDFLLDRQPVGSITEMILGEDTNERTFSLGVSPLTPGLANITLTAKQTRAWRLVTRLGLPFSTRLATPRDTASLLSPPPASLAERQTQALRLVARLRQPFGALLLTPTRQNAAEYRRVAPESTITVQVEITPMILNKLIDGVRMLDVL